MLCQSVYVAANMQPRWFIIPLTKGKVTIVDSAGYQKAIGMSWSATKCKNGWYARGGIRLPNGKVKTIWLARFLMDSPEDLDVDHENGNTLDNRYENLRICTHGKNCYNQGKSTRNSSGYKGVSYSQEHRKWAAQIRIDGKNHYLGRFITSEEAAREYDRMALIHHGEFAYLNFPGDRLTQLV